LSFFKFLIQSFVESGVAIFKNKTYDLLMAKVGEIFHLDVHYNAENQLELFVNEKLEIVFIGTYELNPTKWIQVNIFLYALFVFNF